MSSALSAVIERKEYLTPQLNGPSEFNGAGRATEQTEIKLWIWTQTRPPRVAKHCGQVNTDFQDTAQEFVADYFAGEVTAPFSNARRYILPNFTACGQRSTANGERSCLSPRTQHTEI